MGLRPKEFRQYTWYEFRLAAEGYGDRQVDQWRQVRQLCYFMGNHKATRPEDLWKLPGEGLTKMSKSQKESALKALREAQSNE